MVRFYSSSRSKLVKKLNLEINALEVESFQTSRPSTWEGIVQGREDATAGGDTRHG
jgi:hypothetical protein